MDTKKGVQSLRSLALRGCIRHVNLINNVGSLPFELVEPILKKIKAEQLETIEKNCPQIRANSELLWKRLIETDFTNRVVPGKDFRKTYARYHKEKQKHLNVAKQRLRLNMMQQEKEKEAKKTIQLQKDPIAERKKQRVKMSSRAPAGSRYLHQTYNALKQKGSLFSKNNMKFEPSSVPSQPVKPHLQQQQQLSQRAQSPTSIKKPIQRKEPSIFLTRKR